jgi:formylglycine-generating enzyme required for sulfatase activity
VNSLVVDGGQFHRRYDQAPDRLFPDLDFPATVSSFRLDRYEVTVGRFRAFVEAGMGTRYSSPPSGAGAHPNLPGSGWDASWNTRLPTTTGELIAGLFQDLPQLPVHTWTDSPGLNEDRPINNLTWYEAMAFCIWDGGYLPTATEWNYAAAGGDQQRAYPWSSPPASLTIDGSYASYGDIPSNGDLSQARCFGDGSPECAVTDLIDVGTKPNGDGRWGQSDLSGNVTEWTLDWDSPSLVVPCIDCANLTPSDLRTAGNGSFLDVPREQRASWSSAAPPSLRATTFGARCARPGP